jgi:hypothetical protein
MAGMGLVRLAAEANVVREGYAQIYAQRETQKEIVDAKRTKEALHGCLFSSRLADNQAAQLEMVLGLSRGDGQPLYGLVCC